MSFPFEIWSVVGSVLASILMEVVVVTIVAKLLSEMLHILQLFPQGICRSPERIIDPPLDLQEGNIFIPITFFYSLEIN
jgi:hypothetical protein